MTTEVLIPTAAEMKEAAENRAQVILDNGLRRIKEDFIEPAVRQGRAYTEMSVWDVTPEAMDVLRDKGYTIDDTYRESRSTYIISWGDVDVAALYPEAVVE